MAQGPMRAEWRAPALAVACLIALAPRLAGAEAPTTAVAPESVYDIDRARGFCAAGDAEAAESCLSQQERAAVWIDQWLDRGPFPHYLSRRAYRNCDVRYGPDLRMIRRCLQNIEDDRRNNGGVLSGSGVTFGR